MCIICAVCDFMSFFLNKYDAKKKNLLRFEAESAGRNHEP